ncbi:acylneuraminate cytidylyltransferase family protein [Treponema primitia]|uniref:acylneuraminate cytidylyltransferase family protein n=1 Tax=Treponema primitia TaxID=88058 RepID=UPI003980966C
MTKNIIGIIPARGGSKGIPRKNIINFCGKPLLSWTIEHAKKSDSIRNVYVSTDDNEISDISFQYGANVIRRPPEIAGDTASSESALIHALNEIEKKEKKVDLIVFYQATSPLRQPFDTDKAVDLFYQENADSLFSATTLDDFTIWGERDGILQSINFDYKNRGRRQDRKPNFLENGSLYIFTPEVLRKENNRIGGKISIYIMPFWQSYEIDSYEEIELCEYYMKKCLL